MTTITLEQLFKLLEDSDPQCPYDGHDMMRNFLIGTQISFEYEKTHYSTHYFTDSHGDSDSYAEEDGYSQESVSGILTNVGTALDCEYVTIDGEEFLLDLLWDDAKVTLDLDEFWTKVNQKVLV